MSNVKIIPISVNDIQLLEAFLQNAHNSLVTFRYFEQRPLTAIKNHLITGILMENDSPIGYGHLDRADDGVWLGIAISENSKGKGYGKIIMDFLMTFARQNVQDSIRLTVDKSNEVAIKLYRKYGFTKVKDINEYSLLMEINNFQ